MTDRDLRQRAIALYDHFTHVDPDRRRFMAELTRLAGGAAAAHALLAGIAASPAAATVTAEDEPTLAVDTIDWMVEPDRRMSGYWAAPKAAKGPLPCVLVIHENRGLQPYTRDVARRLALAGFTALAPDLLTPAGGTPSGDEDKARGMIAALDLSRTLLDATETIKWLSTKPGCSGKVGVVGFCWGGALADRIAVAGAGGLAGVVSFYGPAPAPEDAAKVQVPLLLHYAGLDTRVDQTATPWVAALTAAHKHFASYVYPNVNHAFHNDSAPERYDPKAARLAWERTVAFFERTLT